MMIIEIEEKKVNKLSEHIEESLRHMGKAMQCVDEWMMENGMNERSGYNGNSSYGNRYGSGGNYGNRYPMYGMRDEDEDWDEGMSERNGRRRRDSRGRYY